MIIGPLILLLVLDLTVWKVAYARSKGGEKVYKQIDANLAVIFTNIVIMVIGQVILLVR